MNLQLFNCFNHIEGNNNHKQEKNDTTKKNNNKLIYEGNNKTNKEKTEIFHGMEDANNAILNCSKQGIELMPVWIQMDQIF